MSEQDPERPLEGIAVVGMAGRFPGADDLGELWRNLCGGVESVRFYSREELAAAGVAPALLDDPRYVRAGAALRDVQHFDAGFFDFSAREAELMDPQHRIFLECCWEALENAGYDTRTWPGSIGVFAGMGMSGYLIRNLLSHPDLIQNAGPLQIRILNDNNFLTSLGGVQARPAGAERHRAERLLDLSRGDLHGLPEPAPVPVRHGAGRRRDRGRAARAGLSGAGRRDVSGRPLPRLRRRGARHGGRERRGRGGAQAAGGRAWPTGTRSTR